jgi:transposase
MQGARVLRPDRDQVRWDTVDLESQLPPDHAARTVWQFVQGCDLTEFYARIAARDDQPGRPASDPAVLLALWLYATVDAVGSARAIERLCRDHAAYRWLCGGVPVNHDMLSRFRREGGAPLDALLTRSLTGLVAENLVKLEELTIDGTKIRARAGHGSMAGSERLSRLQARIAARVADLRGELEQDGSAGEKRRRLRAARAAQAQAERLQRARERLTDLESEKAVRAKQYRVEEAAKPAPKVSISDPEVRRMRMADGATRPAWNVQVATSNGFVVGIMPTDRRNDSGLAADLLAQARQRCGRTPGRLLADATALTIGEIAALAESHPGMLVYTPAPAPCEAITPASARNRRLRLRREPAAVQAWRARMQTPAAEAVYRRRKLTEHVHAKMKNRGFGVMMLHGLAKVRVVCLLHALAHNLIEARRQRMLTA